MVPRRQGPRSDQGRVTVEGDTFYTCFKTARGQTTVGLRRLWWTVVLED